MGGLFPGGEQAQTLPCVVFSSTLGFVVPHTPGTGVLYIPHMGAGIKVSQACSRVLAAEAGAPRISPKIPFQSFLFALTLVAISQDAGLRQLAGLGVSALPMSRQFIGGISGFSNLARPLKMCCSQIPSSIHLSQPLLIFRRGPGPRDGSQSVMQISLGLVPGCGNRISFLPSLTNT